MKRVVLLGILVCAFTMSTKAQDCGDYCANEADLLVEWCLWNSWGEYGGCPSTIGYHDPEGMFMYWLEAWDVCMWSGSTCSPREQTVRERRWPEYHGYGNPTLARENMLRLKGGIKR